MAEIIAICNQKGGVGKSSTAINLAAGLTLNGFRVLTVDLDSQGNTSFVMGASRDGATALGMLMEEVQPKDAIQKTKYGDIIAGSRGLVRADQILTETGKEYRLRDALEKLSSDYDYIVIDTPPVLGILVVNALTACSRLIIPSLADIFSLQGIADLVDTIKPVRKYCNRNLKIDGILLTKHSNRSGFSQDTAEVAKEIAEKLGTRIYTTAIREAVAIRKSQMARQSIFDYDPASKVAADYMAFTEEIIGKESVHDKEEQVSRH